MAGDWIAMRLDIGDDPAVVAIAGACHIEQDAVVGKLLRLWAWANTHTIDGTAPGITAKWIDDYVRRRGFGAVMAAVGWIRFTNDGVEFPKFDHWNSQSAKSRLLDSRRKQSERAIGVRESSANRPVGNRTKSGHETGQKPDSVGTREEKSREEIKTEDQKKEQRAKRAPATRLPSDWEIPADWLRWSVAEKGWTPDAAVRVSHAFRDYWLSVGEARADWQATWRNWVRREKVDRRPVERGSLAERRTATLDAITGTTDGRSITSTAERVDRKALRSPAEPIREQDGNDVGSGRS